MKKRTIAKMYTYKYNDRLLRTIYQLNNDASVALVDNVYDEVDRLKRPNVVMVTVFSREILCTIFAFARVLLVHWSVKRWTIRRQ